MPVLIFMAAVAIGVVAWASSSSARRPHRASSSSARRPHRALTLAELRAIDLVTATVSQIQAGLDLFLGPAFASRIDDAEARVILAGVQAWAAAFAADPLTSMEVLEHDARYLNASALIESQFTEAERAQIAARAQAQGWIP